MPPELVEVFKDAPGVLLFLFLGAPFLVLLGVVATVIVTRVRDKGAQKVAESNIGVSLKVVEVSEKDADTRQFQAIIDGFDKSLKAVAGRAESAEKKAEAAEQKAAAADELVGKLVGRVQLLEDERHDAIDHVGLLEALIPYPPGPPPRPIWMRPSRPIVESGRHE